MLLRVEHASASLPLSLSLPLSFFVPPSLSFVMGCLHLIYVIKR